MEHFSNDHEDHSSQQENSHKLLDETSHSVVTLMENQSKLRQQLDWNFPSEGKALQKPVRNISKNLQSFLEISPMQKEVLILHKLKAHTYEQQNPFGLKEDNPSQKNCQDQLSHPGLSHIEQDYQESLIQGKIHIQQSWNEGLEY